MKNLCLMPAFFRVGLPLLCAVIFMAPLALAQPDLSLDEALILAHQNSPTLNAARARLAGAQAHLQVAGSPPNPTLAVAQPYAIKGQTGGFDEGVLAAQIFELGGKRAARTGVAQGELAAVQAEQNGALAALDFAVRSAYFEALSADAQRELAASSLQVNQKFLDAGQAQFQAGDVARRDVVRANIEVARAQGELEKAQSEGENRYANLRSLLGLPTEAPLHLTGTLDFQLDNFDVQTLQDFAAKNRAESQSASALIKAREAAIREARAQGKPDAFVEGRRTKLYPSNNGLSVRVGIEMPLFDRGRNRAGVREAQAALEEQKANGQETQRTLSLEITTTFNTLQSARRMVESFRKGRLDQAKELLDMAQTGYEKGASSYLEVLDAQQLLRSEQTEYTRALAAFNIARADVQRALGGTLPSAVNGAATTNPNLPKAAFPAGNQPGAPLPDTAPKTTTGAAP